MLTISRAALGCALACMLLGCLPAAVSDAQKLRETEIEECHRLYPNPRPVLPRMKCIGDALVKVARVAAQYGYKNLDLDELLRAKMVLLAERYDAGKMTEAEFQAEKAQIASTHETQVLQRQNSQAMVVAAQQQAAAASGPVSCTRVGNTTTCF